MRFIYLTIVLLYLLSCGKGNEGNMAHIGENTYLDVSRGRSALRAEKERLDYIADAREDLMHAVERLRTALDAGDTETLKSFASRVQIAEDLTNASSKKKGWGKARWDFWFNPYLMPTDKLGLQFDGLVKFAANDEPAYAFRFRKEGGDYKISAVDSDFALPPKGSGPFIGLD